MNWESPYLSRFLRGPAAPARLIVTDRRGWGAPSASPPGTCRTSDEVAGTNSAYLVGERDLAVPMRTASAAGPWRGQGNTR
jgi:hypothetical protein